MRAYASVAMALVLPLYLAGCDDNGNDVVVSDTTPPAAITDLTWTVPTDSSLTLVWTASGDDSLDGIASDYDVRYSSEPDTSPQWWDSVTIAISREFDPRASGQAETLLIGGLLPETTYYAAVKVADEVPNWSGRSNVASAATMPVPDVTAPAAIADLAAMGQTASSIALTWTAPGDDGSTGQAQAYDVRYDTSPLTEATWGEATAADGEPAPAIAGAAEALTVSGLSSQTLYYFAVKTTDEVGNESPISNGASATTSSRWTVDPGGGADFTRIQDAIDAAGAGDSILVSAGTYIENLTIDRKAMVLIGAGADQTIVEGYMTGVVSGRVLEVSETNGLRIEGLHFVQDSIWCENAVEIQYSEVTIDRCLFVTTGLSSINSTLTLRQSTLYRTCPNECDFVDRIVYLENGTATLENNIIVESIYTGIECDGASVTFRCNDNWGHSGNNYSGCADPTGTNGNISADPLLVNPSEGDFTLAPGSPCEPQMPPGCTGMGVFPGEGPVRSEP